MARFTGWLHADGYAGFGRLYEIAGAFRYARSRWRPLTRYLDAGRLEISNNAAENAIRPVALGRKNWLFAGSDSGGERAAVFDMRNTTQSGP